MSERRFSVGLTGGVASGKTTVANRFSELGVEVFDADQAARAVVERGTAGFDAVVERFGAEVLKADGNLDRGKLRAWIFADHAARTDLEAIIHPLVRTWLKERVGLSRGPYVIVAIPLLVESGPYPWLSRILVVDVDVAVQRARLLARDGVDGELADAMIAAQATRAERLAVADDVLDNSGAIAAIDAQVHALHERYLRLAQS